MGLEGLTGVCGTETGFVFVLEEEGADVDMMEMGGRDEVDGTGVSPFTRVAAAVVDSGREVILVVGVTVDDGGDGNERLPLIMADSRWAADGGGVGIDPVETRCPLRWAVVPFGLSCGSGSGDADFKDVKSGAIATSSGVGTMMLDCLLARPGGGGLIANSCAPGVGGGRKEEEGDGKGDEESGPSMQRDTGR